MTVREFYALVGSYEDAAGRLGDEGHILHYLQKFRRDGNYDGLCRAMAAHDPAAAFQCVHNLKGMYLNLAMTRAGARASELCEALRGGSMPPEAAAMMAGVQQEHGRVLDGLSALLDGQEVAP